MTELKIKHIMDKCRFAWYLLQYAAACLVAPLFRRRKEYDRLWLIAERGVDAGDNGYHLFRYIRTRHPEINIRYVISDDSPDRAKVSALGETVSYRSFRHMLAFVLSGVKISTHVMGYSHDAYFFKMLDGKLRIKGKKIFLQHGIIKDDIPYLYADSTRLDLFVCGAKREYEYIRSTYGYPEGIVRFLGLCRYDALPAGRERKQSRTVLVMPTWRTYLERVSGQTFCGTAFYRAYQSLLSSPRLREILEQYGYRLEFFPHHEMLPYLDCFRTDARQVRLSGKGEEVQQALIGADILITDYSSVYFDFGYMGKPVIYYQFDREAYRAGHYQEGYFSYERDGFGPVVETEEELLSELEKALARGCILEPVYEERAERFFERRDRKNCERNFDAIMQAAGEEKDG
ncbi:MAG TPA: CDP-glycerol glycerophosphotransferase family protein [Candidatus Mediterraneibacter merdipullorum]|nr:CDP-glycerol glycerophosphotransferase family protein [Candidatus Mediterraneibacter merdipullorum]